MITVPKAMSSPTCCVYRQSTLKPPLPQLDYPKAHPGFKSFLCAACNCRNCPGCHWELRCRGRILVTVSREPHHGQASGAGTQRVWAELSPSPSPQPHPCPLALTSSAGVHGTADPRAHGGKAAHCEVGHISGLRKG